MSEKELEAVSTMDVVISTACPLCDKPFAPNDYVVRCDTCGKVHHEECWLSNGRCTTLGCSGRATRVVKASVIDGTAAWVEAQAPGTDAVGKTCPYCQHPIKPEVPVETCSECSMPHHQECWNHNGGCTTFGCSNASSRTPVLASDTGVAAATNRVPSRAQADPATQKRRGTRARWVLFGVALLAAAGLALALASHTRTQLAKTSRSRQYPAKVEAIQQDSTSLFIAARDGDVVALRRLTTEGADPNSRDQSDVTPLHLAVANRHVMVVDALLDAGALADTSDADGRSPIDWASAPGLEYIQEELVSAAERQFAQVVFSQSVRSQCPDGLSPTKILAMGPGRFLEIMEDQHGDDVYGTGERMLDQATRREFLSIYAECRREANDALAHRVSPAAAVKVQDLRRALNAWRESACAVVWTARERGNGIYWDEDGGWEDALAEVIRRWQVDSSSDRCTGAESLLKLRLEALRRPKFGEFTGWHGSQAEYPVLWRKLKADTDDIVLGCESMSPSAKAAFCDYLSRCLLVE